MITIVVADGQPVVREGLRAIVARIDDLEIVAEATDGGAAVQTARETDCDVLLIDVSLRGLGGLDVVKQLRAEGVSTPVLFLSSVDEREYAVRLIRGGAQGFVSKESSVEELLSAVRTVAAGLPHASLSDREFEVLQLLAAGRNVKQISEQLHLGETTVSTYRTRLLRKMGLSSNAELTIYAVKHDLV